MFLKAIGNFFRSLVGIAKAAEPIVEVIAPEVAPLYISTLGLAISAETALGATSGTGPQKLDSLIASLLPQATAWAKQNNIDWPEDEIKKWASAVVDTINKIPAPTATAGTATDKAPAPSA